MSVEPSPSTRYRMRGSTNSYTVEGLETLALREILTMDTEIAPVGSEDFKAIRLWEFAVKVFPVRKPLSVRHADTVALGPVCTALSLAQPKAPSDRHITTMDEIRDIVIRDPNDPQALVLLNGLKDDMRLRGITAPKAFAEFFLANQELNRRLKLQVIYRRVSDTVKTNRVAVLLAGLLVDMTFGYTIISGDESERALAIYCATATNIALALLGIYAYRLERWLNINPAKAVLLMIALIYVGFNSILAICLLDSTFASGLGFGALWFRMIFYPILPQ